VTFTEVDGVRHLAEVTAEALYGSGQDVTRSKPDIVVDP
jgi:hypothetical protein